MQCPNCQHENKEGASFCEKCGAQLVNEKKRMSFFERRQAKERERQYILSKASLQAEDLENIPDIDMGEVEATPVCDKIKMKRLTSVKFAVSIIVIAVCIGLIFLLGKLQFNATARVALIFVVFVICAGGGAYAIDNGYKLRIVNAMCKSNFAVKKISYGKPPYMLSGNTFYA
ncbi:MAG: zinc ribbon domain-containing protein, partial [Clostridia bacterium]|nr:zinc ribbon domain-containing protein [Clostridia bacterium]